MEMPPELLGKSTIIPGMGRTLYRYTMEDAKDVQETIRNLSGFETASPFIRKMGDFYAIQVGSYTNSSVAKEVADKLNSEGYSVWVLEN